jgi:hypothetical protein
VAGGICESPIKKSKKIIEDEAALKIQAQAKIFLNKLRFR